MDNSWLLVNNGLIIQYGKANGSINYSSKSIDFPISFTNANYSGSLTVGNYDVNNSGVETLVLFTRNIGSMIIKGDYSSYSITSVDMHWIVIGY